MQAIFVQEGDTVDYTPGSAVTGGDVVEVGSMPLVAKSDIAASTLGALAIEGTVDLAKDTSTFSAGDAVYWDNNGSPVGGVALSGAGTSTASGNNLMGFATADSATGAERVRTKMTTAKRTTSIGGSVTADDITGSDSSLGIAGKAGNASAGGAVVLAGGAAAAGAYDGGAVTVQGGAGPTAGNTGGALTLLSGAGDGTNGTAGAVILDSSGTGSVKGAITIGTNAASLTLAKMPRIPFNLANAAGGNLATATVLTAGWNLIAAQDNSTGVALPSCVNGAQCIIINQSTDKTLKVWPPVGKQINGAGANNAVVMAANTIDFFACEGTNAWYGFTAAVDLA